MSQPMLRSAFRHAQPVRITQHDPMTFFRTSRTPSSIVTPPTRSITAKEQLRLRRPQPTRSSACRHTRAFSTTTRRPATAVLLNPRTDDDGSEMTITISDRAAKRLKQITSTPQKRNTLAKNPVSSDSHLRVTVTSGGCHGFQYLMSLEPKDRIDSEEDTVFVAAEEGEGKAEVVMDQPSLELLKGSTVDFVTELIGSQFKIVGNPRASSSCGCGTSFDIQ
jgi:iron-sulfur cluster assembly 2